MRTDGSSRTLVRIQPEEVRPGHRVRWPRWTPVYEGETLVTAPLRSSPVSAS